MQQSLIGASEVVKHDVMQAHELREQHVAPCGLAWSNGSKQADLGLYVTCGPCGKTKFLIMASENPRMNASLIDNKQESRAIAKVIARCALCKWMPEQFREYLAAHTATFAEIDHGFLLRSIV